MSGSLATQIVLLLLIARVLLRVATKPLGHGTILADLLRHASHVLQTFEPLLLWTDEAQVWKFSDAPTVPAPPHGARRLFEITNLKDTPSDTRYILRAWAENVTTLWRVAMTIDESIDVGSWNNLTCRLLLLRASPRFSSQSRYDIPIEEWARREALRCLLKGNIEEEKMMEA